MTVAVSYTHLDVYKRQLLILLNNIIMNKIILFLSISFFITNSMAQEKIVQTAGRTQLGEFAPKFAELNDDVLFGEV